MFAQYSDKYLLVKDAVRAGCFESRQQNAAYRNKHSQNERLSRDVMIKFFKNLKLMTNATRSK